MGKRVRGEGREHNVSSRAAQEWPGDCPVTQVCCRATWCSLHAPCMRYVAVSLHTQLDHDVARREVYGRTAPTRRRRQQEGGVQEGPGADGRGGGGVAAVSNNFRDHQNQHNSGRIQRCGWIQRCGRIQRQAPKQSGSCLRILLMSYTVLPLVNVLHMLPLDKPTSAPT